MRWRIPRIWDGSDVWLIGGGATVPYMFGVPEDIIKGVKDGRLPLSSYSPYMKDLWDRRVIGINMAYKIGNWMDMIFFGDVHFFLPNEEGLRRYPGLVITCHSQFAADSQIKYLTTDERVWGISELNDRVCWNWNSGAAAISIAVHTGAKRILLLGFDMKMVNGWTHWHSEYKLNGIEDTLPHIQAVFDRHKESWPVIAEDAKRMGVEILNVTINSEIDVFRKVKLEEVL